MSTALSYLYDIYSNFLDFVFDDMLIDDGISFGWICISCLIFGILIKSLLNLPSAIHYDTRNRAEAQIGIHKGFSNLNKRGYF